MAEAPVILKTPIGDVPLETKAEADSGRDAIVSKLVKWIIAIVGLIGAGSIGSGCLWGLRTQNSVSNAITMTKDDHETIEKHGERLTTIEVAVSGLKEQVSAQSATIKDNDRESQRKLDSIINAVGRLEGRNENQRNP